MCDGQQATLGNALAQRLCQITLLHHSCALALRFFPLLYHAVLWSAAEGGDGSYLAITSHNQLHYDDHTEIVVFAESALLMRRYNSVSLSEGGRYRLTLSECHGIVGGSGSANIASSAPGSTEQSTATRPENIERVGLSFLPVPLSIVFEVDGQVCFVAKTWKHLPVGDSHSKIVGRSGRGIVSA